MEKMRFLVPSKKSPSGISGITTGVVNSGNLEVLVENSPDDTNCLLEVATPVKGYYEIWKAVVTDFCNQFAAGGLKFSLNDSGAVPAVVALRLRQAYESYNNLSCKSDKTTNYSELSPRQRILSIVDEGSFREIYSPVDRLVSPHLGQLDILTAFDDGAVIGDANLEGNQITIAAQQFAFMGGAVGEVNGAKIAGICLRAVKNKAKAVVLLLDSGGVRLQEANAGEIAISEIISAIMEVRKASIPIISIVAGKNGAFGGVGIIAACTDYLFMSELGRSGVSGPEVIETVMGVEEYDASDRSLVWRTCGGKNRSILGFADYVSSNTSDIRNKIISVIDRPRPVDTNTLHQENMHLAELNGRFSNCSDAIDIWNKLGIGDSASIPSLNDDEFVTLLTSLRNKR